MVTLKERFEGLRGTVHDRIEAQKIGETMLVYTKKGKDVLRDHGVYIAGAVAGSTMVAQAIGKVPKETISEKLRRYGQIVLGAGITVGSVLADLYDNNVFDLQKRFEVGIPYVRRRPTEA